MQKLILISDVLCPYVQRAAIALSEKNIPYERTDIDLGNKPAWFLEVSPLGKTPVLKVGDAAVFESHVILEYLEDCYELKLHPDDPLERAQHRSWMAFSSSILDLIGGFYSTKSRGDFEGKQADLRAAFRRLELAIEARGARGPWFGGETFSLVDACYGPAFRYFDVIESFMELDIFYGMPLVQAWRQALAERPSVKNAVAEDYEERLKAFLRKRGSVISGYLDLAAAEADWVI